MKWGSEAVTHSHLCFWSGRVHRVEWKRIKAEDKLKTMIEKLFFSLRFMKNNREKENQKETLSLTKLEGAYKPKSSIKKSYQVQ